jgi:DNA-binding protein HU-beta
MLQLIDVQRLSLIYGTEKFCFNCPTILHLISLITAKLNHMRKNEIINQIANATGVPKVDVIVVVETFFQEVKRNLSQGENIYIRGFGSYVVKKRAAKVGRNIKNNTAVHIPEHFIPAFRPSREFTEQLRDLDPAKYEPAKASES